MLTIVSRTEHSDHTRNRSLCLSQFFPPSLRFAFALAAVLFLTLHCLAAGTNRSDQPAKMLLADNWQLQSSCQVQAAGEQISMPDFPTGGWHKTSVPTTVVAALVADGTYPDPYWGMNLKSLPGMDYKPTSTSFFANIPMPADSPFRCSWWFRTEFDASTPAGEHQWLHFDGINYRANVWLNGNKVGNADDIAGMMRLFELDVTEAFKTRTQCSGC